MSRMRGFQPDFAADLPPSLPPAFGLAPSVDLRWNVLREAGLAVSSFAPLAGTYDCYANLHSFGQDPRWRAFLVSRTFLHYDCKHFTDRWRHASGRLNWNAFYLVALQ